MPSVTAFLIVALSAAGSAFALTFQGTEISGVTWEGGVQPTFLAYISTATDGLACVKACQATSGCSVASYQSNLCIHYKANAAVAAIADPDSAPNPIFFAIPGECQGGLPDTYTTDTNEDAPCTVYTDTTPSGTNTRLRLARQRRAALESRAEAERS